MAVTPNCDVLVIGGGIHGVGVAQAAAAAGYDVVLLEKTQLAAGTSSRSSKLIHGGLRYLESGEFSLVRESLRERELLLKLAPSLVKRQRFFIPIYSQTTRRPWLMRVGLSFYAVLAGLGEYERFETVPRDDWDNLDGLKTAGLQKVFQYWDAQTDDGRLTQAVMESAQELGAELVCPATFESAEIHRDGCKVSYVIGDELKYLKSATVVNAAGPWARRVAARVTPAMPDLAVDNVQGAHLELPGRLVRGCYYLEVPDDRRAVFAMPWKNDTTLLGTTEHKFQGNPADVVPLPSEKEYLLKVYRHYFPHREMEVLSAWAGLRVLPAATNAAFSRSRETQFTLDNERAPRMLSIFGGKLTGYRATAERVLSVLKKTLPPVDPVAQTNELRLD